VLDQAKATVAITADPPHVLREAVLCCRKGGTVSIPDVFIGFPDNNRSTGFQAQDLEQAQASMEQTQIRRLPVLSRDKQLVALADLATKASAAKAGKAIQANSTSR
jgi:hypothetical protein